jgi:hypothetical protein
MSNGNNGNKKKSKLQLIAEAAHAHGKPCAETMEFDKPSAEWALSTSLGNRVETESDIDRIAQAENRGEHIFDGNPLSFERGEFGQHLFDGHHRCKARLRALDSANVTVVVTFNSPPGSQRIRVSGRAWNLKAWTDREGLNAAQSPIISAIHRAVAGHVSGKLDDTHIRAARAVCAEGIDAAAEYSKKHDRLSLAPVLAGVAMAWKLYPESAKAFLAHYIQGGRPLRCPAYTLREQVLRLGRVANQQTDERVKLTWATITAVAMFDAHEEVSIIRPGAPRVEPVLAAWKSIRGGYHVDVAEWMKKHQKKRHRQE